MTVSSDEELLDEDGVDSIGRAVGTGRAGGPMLPQILPVPEAKLFSFKRSSISLCPPIFSDLPTALAFCSLT